MPIQVTCPGCLKRFTVADKYAGQKGPCPKCKAVITIPKKEDEVIIHAPEHSEAGAVGVGGRHALKTYKWRDTKFKPLVFTAVAGFVLVALLVALVLRSTGNVPDGIRWAAAAILGPPLAWASYTFLRDPEFEGYQGINLLVRAVICGLVFALLWGVFWFLGERFFGDSFSTGLEIWQMVALIVPVFAAGTLAAYASFDLDPGSAFFSCAMYFAVTVMLRVVAGLPAIPGLGGA